MSRPRGCRATGAGGFPCVSGDEPVTIEVRDVPVEFSPRERG